MAQTKKPKVGTTNGATRTEDYVPQQGRKATLSLADFTDEEILQNSVVAVTAENYATLK